jgi:hypothetical protein
MQVCKTSISQDWLICLIIEFEVYVKRKKIGVGLKKKS